MKPTPLVEAVDGSVFGGKAVALGECLRAGLPVPDGSALGWAQVEAFTHSEQFEAAVAALLRQHGPLAVRSSAVGEDSATASFAGQHLTVLNANTVDQVTAAVRAVHASGRTPSALAYRARMGITGAPRVAVVLQRQLLPTCAGVLFTRDPQTGAEQRVIEASWGLGEAVVSGLVTPDRYQLSREGALLGSWLGTKDLMLEPSKTGGTTEVPVSPERVEVPCLDARQLALLHELAGRCERAFEGAHDLEWAFVDTEVFLLQRRPITVARPRL